MGVLLSCFFDESYQRHKMLQNKGENQFYTIRDQYKSLSDVQEALRKSGLEASQLIIGKQRFAAALATLRRCTTCFFLMFFYIYVMERRNVDCCDATA